VQIEEDLDDDYAIHRADLVSADRPWRHDSDKLAKVIMDILADRTGPLVE
jgi:hypothetical protein